MVIDERRASEIGRALARERCGERSRSADRALDALENQPLTADQRDRLVTLANLIETHPSLAGPVLGTSSTTGTTDTESGKTHE